ncbi:hypothetical protein GW17_00015706 [Ensete ventricosum]|nr:hypothetical protein GW17_00015706 [Ensete ventricosum]
MYEGHQVPYSRPGTGKVGNPYLQAHASPPVRRHGKRRDSMVSHECGKVVRTPEPSPESPLIRTSSTLCRRDCEAGGLTHTGLDQRRLAQHI